jgi:hypothetical protein
LKREAFLTRSIKKIFLEAMSKLQLRRAESEPQHNDEAIFNSCIYTHLLDAYQNLTTPLGKSFVEELVPMRQNFPQADLMHAMMKVLSCSLFARAAPDGSIRFASLTKTALTRSS